jgi:hypothetical protein
MQAGLATTEPNKRAQEDVPKYTNPRPANKFSPEEWCLLGCYAVWLL